MDTAQQIINNIEKVGTTKKVGTTMVKISPSVSCYHHSKRVTITYLKFLPYQEGKVSTISEGGNK